MYKLCPNKASLSESHTRDLQTDLDQQQQDANTTDDLMPVQLVHARTAEPARKEQCLHQNDHISTPVTQSDSQQPLNSNSSKTIDH